MAVNKFRYQHLRSNSGATPTAGILKEGELAVGYLKGSEKLFIKNTDDEIIKFIPENAIDEKLTGVTTEIDAISGAVATLDESKFGHVFYDDTNRVINFYDKDGGDILGTVSTDDFIIDGMIDSVEIKDVTLSGETVRCLVIVWNTDAGKEEVDIPLTDIFNPEDYYTKQEIDALISSVSGDVEDVIDAVIELSGDVATVSGDVITINNEVETLSANMNNYYTKEETSGATEIATALSGKQDTLVSGTNIKTLTKQNYDLIGSGTQEVNIVDLSDITVDSNNDVIFDAGSF